MNAIQNVNTYMQSNKKLNNLEIIQKQIQDELDMIPER
jgi:wobble nucleotide-excising tRNase